MNAEDFEDLFYLPLSQAAFVEFEDLQEHLIGLPGPQSEDDVWSYIWGNGTYTSQRLYKLVFANTDAHPTFGWIWKAKCTPRIKFFAWLVLVDRLNTKDMLRRRHYNTQDDDLCVLCSQGTVEDIQHLFFTCTFARRCWQALNIQWNEQLGLLPRLTQARANSNLPFFVDMVMIASWEIWKMRNGKIFHGKNPSFNTWLANFKNQCNLQLLRFRGDLRSSFCAWLDAFS